MRAARTLLILALLSLSFGMFAAPMQAQATGFMRADTLELRRRTLLAPPLTKADQIVVYKSKHMMYLMRDNRILRKYRVALGKNPVGHKLEWGDYRTPEGKYTIDMKNADSNYFLSLRISYPDATDADVAAALEVRPGDWIMIHGLPNDRDATAVGHPRKDWTNGCIAVDNAQMAEIWRMVDVGTKISIWP